MRVLRAVAALGLLATGLAACSSNSESSLPRPNRAFCQAAYDFDTNAPNLADKPHKQTELVQRMADNAPKDVAADARTVLDAMQRVLGGDDSVRDDPKIKDALNNVERRAINGCKLFEQNQDGTGGI
jgi:hypothetical protein